MDRQEDRRVVGGEVQRGNGGGRKTVHAHAEGLQNTLVHLKKY